MMKVLAFQAIYWGGLLASNGRDVVALQSQIARISIQENTQRDIGNFDEWANGCGVQRSEGFELGAMPSESELDVNVGVTTSTDLPAGQPVLCVPSFMVLSAMKTREELGAVEDAEQEIFAQLGTTGDLPQFYLFLRILAEYEMGTESSWYPWLNALPRYFSNGSSMTHFCCSECLPPLVGNLANKERIRFIQFFRALKYAPYLSQQTKGDRSLAKWAFAVVFTRSFPTGDGDVRIAPMADMFNHGTQAEVEISYDEDGNCYAYSTYDIPAGSPLTMSYGDPTNPSHLFARYGFLDESSPATFCKIMVSKPSQELINMGYDHSKMLFYKDTGDVSQEVWDVLLYQILGESSPGDQQALYTAHMAGDDETKQAIHNKYYSQTSAALLNHVDTFLHQLDNLSGKAVGRDPKVHPRLPMIRKHNEFVRNTFMRVRENL
jgi:hypothetical protein